MDNIKTYKSIVSNKQSTIRIDRFLAVAHPEVSRSRIKALLLDQKISLNGQLIVSPSYKVKEDDVIEIIIPETKDIDIIAQKMDLDIIYEDDDLIIINKKAGIVVHPAPGNYDNTLVNGLMYHCGDSLSGIGGVKRPGIVHRIDKDTSGVIVVAKSDAAHSGLSELFQKHDIERLYQAIIWGRPNPIDGSIEGNIGRHPVQRKKMTVVGMNAGKHAITHYKIIKSLSMAASLIECRLETGRTHQIRVHMTSMGHPLIGDQTYGNPTKNRLANLSKETQLFTRNFPRQALHAKSLGFIHPVSGEKLHFEAKIPDDMQMLINILQQ